MSATAEHERTTKPAVSAAERDLVVALHGDYAWLLDEDRLEEWLHLFTEDCVYKVVPRENLKFGIAGCLMLCVNKDMLRDRVTSLRQANKFNIHVDRHLIGPPRVRRIDAHTLSAETAYTVFQSNQEGESRLFSVGCYIDRIEIDNGAARLREKIVIVDSFSVPTLLATPL
jgi:anthranilate 1,2-dioxygenase small subunit